MDKTYKRNLERGIEVEQEHEDTYEMLKKYVEKKGKLPPKKKFFKSIAKDHLKESHHYYDFLDTMEKYMEDTEEEKNKTQDPSEG